MTDVTDIEDSLQQLTESEAFYRQLIEEAPVALGLIRSDYWQYLNQAAQQLGGYTSADLKDKHFLDMVVSEDKEAALSQHRNRLLGKYEENPFVLRITTKAGEEKPLLICAQLLASPQETTLLYTAMPAPTPDKAPTPSAEPPSSQANEALLRMRKGLVDNISHEIRTPMNRIMGFSSLLNDAALTDEERTFYFNEVLEGSNQLLTIINNLIKISDIEAGLTGLDYQAIDMNELIETVCAQVKPEATKKGIKMSVTISRCIKTPWITDYEKVTTILNNLLCNAIKFTASGQIDIGYQKHKDNLTLHVKDTGIGITQEEMSHIFDVFTKGGTSENMFKNGLGLGLTISQAYAKQLGGKLWAESAPGKGSIFYVTIPNGPL